MRAAQITLSPLGDIVLADNAGTLTVPAAPPGVARIVEWLRGDESVGAPPKPLAETASQATPQPVEDLF